MALVERPGLLARHLRGQRREQRPAAGVDRRAELPQKRGIRRRKRRAKILEIDVQCLIAADGHIRDHVCDQGFLRRLVHQQRRRPLGGERPALCQRGQVHHARRSDLRRLGQQRGIVKGNQRSIFRKPICKRGQPARIRQNTRQNRRRYIRIRIAEGRRRVFRCIFNRGHDDLAGIDRGLLRQIWVQAEQTADGLPVLPRKGRECVARTHSHKTRRAQDQKALSGGQPVWLGQPIVSRKDARRDVVLPRDGKQRLAG